MDAFKCSLGRFARLNRCAVAANTLIAEWSYLLPTQLTCDFTRDSFVRNLLRGKKRIVRIQMEDII